MYWPGSSNNYDGSEPVYQYEDSESSEDEGLTLDLNCNNMTLDEKLAWLDLQRQILITQNS